MTDALVTQISAELWASTPPPDFRTTQISGELWAAIQTPNTSWSTQISAEAWVRIHRPNLDWITQISTEVWLSKGALGVTYAVFPTLDGLGYSVFWNPEFANISERSANKAEIDFSLADTPIHEFELTFNFLRNYASPDEFKMLMGFFLHQRANAGRFLFLNPDDNSVTGEPVGTTDGVSNDYGPLQRTFGIAPNTGTEPVGYVNLSEPLTVYLDGTPVGPSAFSITQTFPMRQMLHFLIPPLAGQAITIDYHYYYYVKYADDKMSFEKFMSTLWTIKRLTLRSRRYLT